MEDMKAAHAGMLLEKENEISKIREEFSAQLENEKRRSKEITDAFEVERSNL